VSRTAELQGETQRTDCRDGGDDFAQFELVQNGRLTGGVESDHEDAHLLFAKEAGH
jgi:hypothetical protein